MTENDPLEAGRALAEIAMDPAPFTRIDPTTWRVEPTGRMRVPAIIYADEDLIRGMDDKVFAQATNVAMLPGALDLIEMDVMLAGGARWAVERGARLRQSLP